MTLPLSLVADITYNLPSISAPQFGFDLGLILGTSDVIDPTDRVVVYSSLAEMVEAGFSVFSEEYLAATRYFGAESQPSQIAIGRWQSGEQPLTALQDCRAKNQDWYIAYIPSADDDDHLDIAAYVETLDAPYTQYFLQSANSTVLAGASGNLFETLHNQGYTRTHGLYSTSAHAIASIMGYAMGATNTLANSNYTLKFKKLPGATPDNITTQQYNNITAVDGNAYVNMGNFYNLYANGTNFGSQYFDVMIGLDMLINLIQNALMEVLTTTPKVPQTEEGMGSLKSAISQQCDKMATQGFIAPGVWKGANILNVKTNDTLALGYVVLSEPIDDQDETDRANRIAPPIYVLIKLAGAIHTVAVRITVNP